MSKIFISHSSKDEKLVSAFIEKILNLGLGVERSTIFYTSAKDTAPKSGSDFRTAIKDKMREADVIIQIITEEYKKSEVCLNEMGAAWVLSDNVIPFILDPVRFESIGFIHSTSYLLKLNSPEDLFKFQDDHPELYTGRRITQANYHKQVNEFIDDLKKGRFSNNGWYIGM
jgi:hypothetical protein